MVVAALVLLVGLATDSASAEAVGTDPPAIGSRVRFQSGRPGGEWREGMFNATREEPPCHVVVVFKPRASRRAALEVESTVTPDEITRLQVFVGPRKAMPEWAGIPRSPVPEGAWREAPLPAKCKRSP